MNRFVMRRFITILCTSGLLGITTQSFASGFQLWEQDAVSVGNYHAGYAAEANDASIAWYNPAGITRFKNQQAVFDTSVILTDFKYNGSVGLTENSFQFSPVIGLFPTTVTMNNITAQGGTFNVVPNLHYVAPINDWIGFGFSVVVPFGLKTNYGASTNIRYAATYTSMRVVDISPSLGVKLTDKASIGAGFDIQKASAEFDNVGGLISPFTIVKTIMPEYDTASTNKGTDTGYGFHAGYLYEFSPETRVGISYHSQVVHHFSGTSRFEGGLNYLINHGETLVSGHSLTNVRLPAYTVLSAFHRLNPCWAVMGTVTYTQWNIFKTLTLQNVAGAVNVFGSPVPVPSVNIAVNIPQYYHNTYSFSVGANYYPTDTIILRTGIGYDQTPITSAYRNIQLPDSDRYVFALGGHFQATKTIGFDLGWSHVFYNGHVGINPPPLVMGAETVTENGSVKGRADVFSGQIVWDII